MWSDHFEIPFKYINSQKWCTMCYSCRKRSIIFIKKLGRSGLSTWKYQFSYDH